MTKDDYLDFMNEVYPVDRIQDDTLALIEEEEYNRNYINLDELYSEDNNLLPVS